MTQDKNRQKTDHSCSKTSDGETVKLPLVSQLFCLNSFTKWRWLYFVRWNSWGVNRVSLTFREMGLNNSMLHVATYRVTRQPKHDLADSSISSQNLRQPNPVIDPMSQPVRLRKIWGESWREQASTLTISCHFDSKNAPPKFVVTETPNK